MDVAHRTSDRQSLMLTQAAIHALTQTPALIDAVLGTLDHWDAVAPPASKALRDEWREIITTRAWRRALEPDQRGQQLRQASPLGKALDPALRLAIIRQCKGRSSNI
jgi:hypothetical protein